MDQDDENLCMGAACVGVVLLRSSKSEEKTTRTPQEGIAYSADMTHRNTPQGLRKENRKNSQSVGNWH